MRTIERSSAFKRDYKRESKGRHGKTLGGVLLPVLKALEADLPLAPRLHDHELGGDWIDYRECT